MTGAPRRVASKGALRLAAWSSAAAALVASWGVFGALPKPIAAATVLQTRPKIVVVRQVLRRVIVQEAAPATPPTTVTFTPASGSSAPPAPTSTGGSAP